VIELAAMAQFTQTFDVNVFGVVRVTKAFLPSLRQTRGRTCVRMGVAERRLCLSLCAHPLPTGIVNVASMAGTVALPGQAAYAASKHAVVGFTDALRRELHPFDVTVVSIEPVRRPHVRVRVRAGPRRDHRTPRRS
jgi:NAD(P)-dependent dehydrogenase (short-subunit alcohol dehydrogenase family)